MVCNKKRGFTLIELLAVIVILAIIALIATPIILNMLEDSKKASAKVGTTHYVDTLEKELMYEDFKQDINPEGMYLIKEDGTYEVNGKIKKLSIKGSLPSSGTLCVDEKGMVDSYSVVLDGYVVTKTGEEQEIEKGTIQKSITCNVAEEIVEIKIPENNNTCSQTKEVIINYPHYEATVKEYSLDSKNWLEYKESVIMEENGTLYARLRKGNKVSSVATMLFTTIDNDQVSKTAPSLVLSTEKPTSEINVTFKQTDNCGLDENTIEYGISETTDGTYTWQKEAIFKGLKNNKTYYIKTRANDIANNDVVESYNNEITTKDFGNCNIEISNYGTWTPSKTATITGETTAGTILQYRIYEGSTKEDTNWIDTTNNKKITLDAMATEEEPTTVYCRYVEKNEKEEIINTLDPAVSSSVTKIDTTAPLLTLDGVTKTTKSITIPYTSTDSQSEISGTTCVYGKSTNYGNNGTISDNKCVINDVNSGTPYYYKIITTNNAGIKTEVTGNTETIATGTCSIEVTNDGTWTQSKVATIKGNTTTGEKLQYRVVSGKTEKVTWTTISSGKTETINWEANTTTPTYIYCRVTDDINTKDGETKTITTIDKTAPPIPTSVLRYGSSSGTVRTNANSWTNQTLWWGSFSSKDTGGSGTNHYEYSTSCTGTKSGNLNSSYTYSSNANSYYCIRAVDTAGNASAWSGAYYIKIDKTAPGTASSTIRIGSASGTVRANTTAWTNQTLWWGGFSASDTGGSGVSYYQYSTNCTGTASATLSSSYTYSSNTNYTFCIRAVDTAGNAGAWSGAYYIRIDKTAPTVNTDPVVFDNPFIGSISYSENEVYNNVYLGTGTGSTQLSPLKVNVNTSKCTDNLSLKSCTISCSSSNNLVKVNNSSSSSVISNTLDQSVALVTCKVTATDEAGNSASRDTNFYTGSGWYKKPNTTNNWKFIKNNKFLYGFHELTWYKTSVGTTKQQYYFATEGDYQQGYVSEPYVMYIGARYVDSQNACYYFTDNSYAQVRPDFPIGAKIYGTQIGSYHLEGSGQCTNCEIQSDSEKNVNICCSGGNCSKATISYLNSLLQ